MGYETEYHHAVHRHLMSDKGYRSNALWRDRRLFPGVDRQATIFEFGCGLGQNIYLRREHSTGYDISRFARDHCRKKGISVVDSIEELSGKRFGIVLSVHCLEHLDDPLSNLHLLGSFLADSGELRLVLPLEKNRRIRSFKADVNYHLYSWTPNTIANLLHRAGYVVKTITIGRLGNGTTTLFALTRVSVEAWYLLTQLLSIARNGPKEMLVVAAKCGSEAPT